MDELHLPPRHYEEMKRTLQGAWRGFFNLAVRRLRSVRVRPFR